LFSDEKFYVVKTKVSHSGVPNFGCGEGSYSRDVGSVTWSGRVLDRGWEGGDIFGCEGSRDSSNIEVVGVGVG
jgi:hypothetical protein